jgi:hypothetical protein
MSNYRGRIERGVEVLDKEYVSDPKFRGRMLVYMGDAINQTQQTARADELFQRGYEIGRDQRDVRSRRAVDLWRFAGLSLLRRHSERGFPAGHSQDRLERRWLADHCESHPGTIRAGRWFGGLSGLAPISRSIPIGGIL